MKTNNRTSLIVMLLILVGCSVESPDPNQDVQQKVKITVLEKDTRKPVPGTSVDLLKCSKYDFIYGCTKYERVRTFTTNSQGEIEYERINNTEAMQASHADYWETFQKGDYGEILLTPNAWVKIQMDKTGTYSYGSYVVVEAKRECYSLDCSFPDFNKNIGLPADTTFVIRVRATEKTTIHWSVMTPPSLSVVKSDATQPFLVDKFDTLRMKIQY
jgi:5-hydroxyisourate hydrolase-like protein (transthyretin family)